MIEVTGLAHVYPDGTRAVDGVSLAIGAGESVAIIGQNGSGKSTLVRHFNGLLRPTEGDVLVDGDGRPRASRGPPGRDRGSRVPGSRSPDLRRPGPGRGRIRAAEPGHARRRTWRAAVDAALEATGLTDDASANPYDLGYSRRKLLALASILAMQTPVVVLDEPTTGQDARGVARVQAIVGRPVGGRSDSHRRSATTCASSPRSFERVVVMRAGRIVLDGTPGRRVRRGLVADPGLDVPRAAARRPGRRPSRPGRDADGGGPRRGACTAGAGR